MATIRPVRADDLPALYAISVATGLKGCDASHLYVDRDMIGHIYAAPYAVLDPDMALVFEDAAGVAGYVVGTTDTVGWEDLLEERWWPALRQRYPDPSGKPPGMRSADERRSAMIHSPARTPSSVVSQFPAHLHLNLLPRAQGAGLGSQLLKNWKDLAAARGARNLHVGANPANIRAIEFWAKNGFAHLEFDSSAEARTVWMGLS